MKKLHAFLVFVFLTGILSAQEVVSIAGQTNQITNLEISWTVGEPVIETFSSSSNILTQGFHQSKLIVTAIDAPGVRIPELSVFPNPTSDFLIIHFDAEIPEFNYSLFDLSGKVIRLKSATETDTRIDVSSLATGTYLLQIDSKTTNQKQSFKIIKK